MTLCQQEEEVSFVGSSVADSDGARFLRGPFRISDKEDNLAYLYEDADQGGHFVFKNCMDSRLNFLANVSADYASFMKVDALGEERLLVGIRGHFFVFMPNGQISHEVEFSVAEGTIPPGLVLEVQDVSDN